MFQRFKLDSFVGRQSRQRSSKSSQIFNHDLINRLRSLVGNLLSASIDFFRDIQRVITHRPTSSTPIQLILLKSPHKINRSCRYYLNFLLTDEFSSSRPSYGWD